MANAKQKDPVDTLHQVVNDVLIQTGKALRASRTEGPRSLDQVRNILSTRMDDSVDTFHRALDDIEIEIVEAKAVLLRDLEKARANRIPPPSEPVAVAAKPLQTKVPIPHPHTPPTQMGQLGLSQTKASLKQQHSQAAQAHRPQPPVRAPVAPFPDMGMDIQPPSQPSPKVKREAISPAAYVSTPPKPSPRAGNKALKAEARPSPTHMPIQAPTPVQAPTPIQAPTPVPIPVMDDKTANDPFDLPSTGPGGELNFTDMEFTVAPSSDGPNMDLVDLDSFLVDPVPGHSAPPGSAPTAPMAMMGTTPKSTEKKDATPHASHDDIYAIDNIDNMDLDFAGLPVADGGDSTFANDLFLSTDGPIDLTDLDNAFNS